MFAGCVDISHNNGRVIWHAVPASYLLFFMKATQGARFVDPRFAENRDAAEEAGKLVIPYHFLNGEPVGVQAANFVRTAGLLRGSPCMLDWEGEPPPPLEVLEEMVQNIRTTTQRDPIIYHGIYDLVSKPVNACPWMVPKWGPEPKQVYKWLFWQNTNRGHIPGIITYVDHDFFNGDEKQLAAFHKTGKLPGSLAAPPPEGIF